MPSPLTLSPGQRIGPYTVTAPLRAGGMASLYLAQRTGPAGFARKVALKVIHPHLGQDKQFVRMFLDEALLCARIRHPNVVHVEELGEHEGAYFLAMEYVDGVSLAEILDRLCTQGELIDPELAVSVTCAVLEGLRAVHELRGEQGEPLSVVHRDVSPSNILIDRVGHVKLIDFGVAKARGRAVETSAGTLKGKYAYMSPEQAFGRDVDQRTDLYAVGVVLWEMLALRPLFSADNDLALLDQVRAPEVPSLCTIAPHISLELDRVVRWALARDRDQRAPTAWELRQALLAAVPQARSVDASEIAVLVGRISGAPDAEAARLVASSSSTVASTPFGRPSQTEASLSQAAGTNVGETRRLRVSTFSRALLAIGVLLLLGSAWAFMFVPKAPLPKSPRPAVTALPVMPQAPAKTPSLSEPPHEKAAQIAQDPHEAIVEAAAPEPSGKPKRHRVKHPAKGSAPSAGDARAHGIDGVPLVDQPGF